MTNPKQMPERIWAYPPGELPDDGGVFYKRPRDFVEPPAEYIRADLVPQIDVGAAVGVLRRALDYAYHSHIRESVNTKIAESELRRILTEATGGQSDE